MSQWTHLAGIIRVDSMGSAMVRLPSRDKLEKINEGITKALGITSSFEDDIETCHNCNVPSGSEGSLQYRVSRNTDNDEHSLSWGFVSIWGDLRDFGDEDVQSVVDWFQKSLERLEKPEGFKNPADMSMREKADYMLSAFMIRDAVLSIEVEYSNRTILLWSDKEKTVNQICLPPAGAEEKP